MTPATARGVPAEEFAAGRIRLALDSACRPDVQGIADESGLSVSKAEAIRDAILSGKRQHQTPWHRFLAAIVENLAAAPGSTVPTDLRTSATDWRELLALRAGEVRK